MDSLEKINQDMSICQRCELRAGATAPVPAMGRLGSKYFLIGEAPGNFEDRQGMPFVGAAGKKLDTLIKLAKIDMNDIFLTNVCRCRPPENRTPTRKEILACQPFLWRELLLVKPEYIITLGATPLALFCSYGVNQTHGSQLDIYFPDTLEDIMLYVNPEKVKRKKNKDKQNAF